MSAFETGLGIFMSAAALAQCGDKPGCQPFDPYAVTIPVNAPAYSTHGGFRKAQAPNQEPIRVQANPHLSAEQMQQVVNPWNQAAGEIIFIVSNDGSDVINVENDALVGGGNNFRPYSDQAVSGDGSYALGRIHYDRDHASDPTSFIISLRHELGHMLGLKDIYDGVSQTLDTGIPQQCYSATVPNYMGAASLMSYCAATRTATPTAADMESVRALGY